MVNMLLSGLMLALLQQGLCTGRQHGPPPVHDTTGLIHLALHDITLPLGKRLVQAHWRFWLQLRGCLQN